jgi:Peptide-N-glycosidase F, C terminal/Peptide-N-glycosidase F, N terminal
MRCSLASCSAALLLLSACGDPPPATPTGDSSTSGDESTTTVAGSSTTEPADSTSTGEPGGTSTGESTDDGPPPEPAILMLMDEVIFYDGYAPTVDEPVPAGIVRHSNSLHATRLTEEHRDLLQSTLMLGVVVGARCDNYDRIGSVHLALAPKGAETYVPEDVDRIELARFITPFMDMNESPMTVPYEFEVDSVVPILKDEALFAEYDLWLELSIFGVPYAANEEVAGCEGRNDTQAGTLLLYTDSMREAREFDVLLPLAIGEAFNDYTEGASDELGLTRKTIDFELAEDAQDAQLVLITSNHGANAGGEEYIRRDHFVYVDGELALEYRPGRESCEPFRVYNTQANGIYGPSPMTDEEWQSFSNWCPGDVIDIRVIPWGPVTAGAHQFVIDVPDATFTGNEGNFPFSLYVQARR